VLNLDRLASHIFPTAAGHSVPLKAFSSSRSVVMACSLNNAKGASGVDAPFRWVGYQGVAFWVIANEIQRPTRPAP